VKLIVAVVRPERLEAIQEALGAAKVFRLTASDVQAFAPAGAAASGAAAAYAGAAAGEAAVGRVRLEIAVNEEFVEPTVGAIARAGRLGEGSPGDGAVYVLPLEEVIRIRTGERGPAAI